MVSPVFLPFPNRIQWQEGNITNVSLSFRDKTKIVFQRIIDCVQQLAKMPLAAIQSLKTRSEPIRVLDPLSSGIIPSHLQEVLNDTPLHLPSGVKFFGFADSLFQTSGLGTDYSATPGLEGRSQWNAFLSPQNIEGTSDKNYLRFFTDIIGHPESFIEMLKEIGVNSYRFSLEWSVLEPREGYYDPKAIQLFSDFIHKLKQAGIEPYVTLHHFVHPAWFEEKGGFTKSENIEFCVRHAQRMIEQFPEVKYWMTFNEPGVVGFESFVMGDHPPKQSGKIETAGIVMRNLMIAHCKLYQAIKTLHLPHDPQIGITHQWMKSVPLEGKGNLLERMLCSTFSNIGHYSIYNFFKTGKFSLETPFAANVQMEIPKEEFDKNHQFLDFIGVQFYGFPRMKMGLNGGVEYPGFKTKNIIFPHLKTGLTMGATVPKGGAAGCFGVGFYPGSFIECLEEASALKKPIAITETGCDARMQEFGSSHFVHTPRTDLIQALYFRAILPILVNFDRQHPGQLMGFFNWTWLRNHLEWNRGGGTEDTPMLGTVNVLKDEDRKMVGYTLSPAAELLQKVFLKAKEALYPSAAA